jgi:exopolysaccharide biosynthesis polyprenyl glycosylphosphotransferase
MLKERARIIAGSLFTVDLLLVAGSYFLSFWIRSRVLPSLGIAETHLYPLKLYLPLLPAILVIWGGLLLRYNLYHSQRTTLLQDEAWDIVRVCAIGTLLLILLIYSFRIDERLLGPDKISRLWIFLFVVLSCLFLLARMVLVRLTARSVRLEGYNYRTVLIAGINTTALRIAESIQSHPYWGYRILGFVRETTTGGEANSAGDRVLGSLEDIPQIVEDHPVDEVIFALDRQQLDRLENLLLGLEEQGIKTRLALNLFPHAKARVEVGTLDELPVLTYSTTPSSEIALLGKRMMDVAISLVLLAVAWPLMLVIATLLKLLDGGSVLYRQTRCGLHGRRFTLYKFRTMVENADSRQAELAHLNEMTGPVFKVRSDPRVTGIGRLLRRLSLDELPQLWNVLRGDMSLVGPRPPVPQEVSAYQRWQRRRLSMRPGLTCLWQIHGRNEIDFDRWIELDLEYIDNWSPLLDLKILAKTIPVVLTGRGAS